MTHADLPFFMAPGEAVLPLLFPDFVATAEGATLSLQEPLPPEEMACISSAGLVRRRDFTAGRVCARRALARLDVVDAPLPVGSDRQPVWPEGFVGGISHTRGYCGAAVGRRAMMRSIGLDIERVDRLSVAVYNRICTPSERKWIDGHASDEIRPLATLFFSAKECFFKLQYPLTRRYLEFEDVELGIDPFDGTFRVERCAFPDPEIDRHTVEGRFLFRGEYVFTGMTLPASDGD